MTQILLVSVLALDDVSVGDDRSEVARRHAGRRCDPTTGLEAQETRGLLAAAINELSEREKIVVTLYYFEGLTLAEIGDILGVTESASARSTRRLSVCSAARSPSTTNQLY